MAAGRKAGLKAGARLLKGGLWRRRCQTSASVFRKVCRKAAGQGWEMLFFPTAAPGTSAFLGRPALLAARAASSRAAYTFNPQVAGAGWGLWADPRPPLQPSCPPTVQPGCVRPLPPGSQQKWVQTWMFCFCCSTTACYGA